MNPRQRPVALDQTLIALADPTRREILDRLSKGEARVTEVATNFTISLNSVSKHIKMLERAELVERRIVGRDHILRIRLKPLDAVQEWVSRKTEFWAMQLKALDEVLTNEPPKKRSKKVRYD